MRIAPPRRWGYARTPSGDSLADAYLIAHRNASTTQQLPKDYEYRHHPEVLRLEAEAPLHLDGRPRVALPAPLAVALSLSGAIGRRSSGREFGPRALTAAELTTLLFLANGVRPADSGDAG